MLTRTPWVSRQNRNTARMESATPSRTGPPRQGIAETKLHSPNSKIRTEPSLGGWTRVIVGAPKCAHYLVIANSLKAGKISTNLQPAFHIICKSSPKPDMPKTTRPCPFATFRPEYKQKPSDASPSIRETPSLRNAAAGRRQTFTTEKPYGLLTSQATTPRRSRESPLIHPPVRVVKPACCCFPLGDTRTYTTIIQLSPPMDAPKAEIDAMRQMVTGQAQALDNIGHTIRLQIASVYATGSDWTSVPLNRTFTVKRKKPSKHRLQKLHPAILLRTSIRRKVKNNHTQRRHPRPTARLCQ